MSLQNDYTTKEQSNRLLRLGLPRISANLYYDDEDELQLVKDKEHELLERGYFPCWSVGRLMEIYHICISHTSVYGWSYHEDVEGDYTEYLVQEFIYASKELDFSKLNYEHEEVHFPSVIAE